MGKTYTHEFKARIVLEVLREEQTLAQIATKYEIHPNQLVRWKKTVIEGIAYLLSDKRKKENAEKENKELVQELYAQIGELSSKLSWHKNLALRFSRDERLKMIENNYEIA